MQNQFERAEKKGPTVETFVSLPNDTTIINFCKDRAKGNLKSRKAHEILGFLSSCWEKKYMGGFFSARETIFETYIQDILSMSINLSLALYLVFLRRLFNIGPAFICSSDNETLRIDRYMILSLLTHGNLAAFHCLMKYVDPMAMAKVHPSLETYSDKCATGLKTLLVRKSSDSEQTDPRSDPKTKKQILEVIGGRLLLTVLCLAMRSDSLGVVGVLGEVVTCVYRPAVSYAFPNPLITAYRHLLIHMGLISVLDGKSLN